MAEFVNSNILEQFFNVSADTITIWLRKGMPREKAGRFDFIKCVKWRLDEMQKEIDKGIYLTRSEVSELLGYKNEKYINELEAEFGLPKEGFNKYDIRKVIKWFVDYKEAVHQRELLKIKEGNNRDRLDKANAELKEIELAIRRGTLIEANNLEDVLDTQADIYIKSLNVLKTKVAKLLNLNNEQKEVLEKEIDAIRLQVGSLPTNISASAANIG